MSPSSQQLVLFYPFDEIEDGRVLDASGNGNDGLANGNPRILPDDTFGSCLDLDGHTTLALPTQSIPAGSSITASFWARGDAALPANTSILCALDANDVRTLNVHLPWGDGTISFDCGSDGRDYDHMQKGAQPGDYKGAWGHWAFTKDAAGEMRIYLNGALWHLNTGMTRPIPAAVRVTLGAYMPGAYFYHGQVANLRIYSRALAAEEIARDIDDDRTAIATFRTSSPLDFYLRDADDQDVLYIDDDPQTDNLRLGITNTSRQVIELAASRSPGAASADNHHFELKFRPGTLSAATLAQLALEESGWKLAAARRTDGGVSLYLLSAEPQLLQPSATIELHLQHISADPGGGTRGTRVELSYKQMQYRGETIPLGGNRIKHLEIVNQRGKKTLPINVGFIGSSTILNDGRTPNSLTLRLSNVSPTDTIALNPFDSPTPSKFIISFDVAGDWALGTVDQVSAITVAGADWGSDHKVESDWHIQKETMGNSPQWTLTHLNKAEPGLAPGHVVQLTISNIISSLPSGQTNLYVRYENIPGYWDGQFFRTVEKGPLLVVGQNVGIGTTTPQAKLHVKGEARVEGLLTATQLRVTGEANAGGQLAVDARFKILTDHAWGEPNRTLLALEPKYQNDDLRTRVFLYAPNHYYTNVPAITLAGNYGAGASVGIGTTEPAAPLHVKGEARVEGPLTATQLRVTGATSVGGQLAVGARFKILTDYAWGDTNRTLLELEPKYQNDDLRTRVFLYAPNHYYTNEPAITLAGNYGAGASVGVGTTTPTEKLEIKLTGGDGQQANFVSLFNDGPGATQESRIVWKNGAEKKYAAAIASRPGGGYNAGDLRFQTASNGALVDRVIIDSAGNVGIGTTAPAAPLHVYGQLRVDGFVSSFTKFFRIAHPTVPGRDLVHACLEGPENGVYYRGTARLVDGAARIRLPEYFEALTRKDGRTAMFTPRGREPFLLSYDAIVGGALTVYADRDEGEFDWEVKAVRADVEQLRVEVERDG
ncbi:MAG: LamG domain-containing protein [Kouleothrix sp.]|nr:LamG domain-containing protein [Kouleothrix sp.]